MDHQVPSNKLPRVINAAFFSSEDLQTFVDAVEAIPRLERKKENKKLFLEKLQYLKLHDRSPTECPGISAKVRQTQSDITELVRNSRLNESPAELTPTRVSLLRGRCLSFSPEYYQKRRSRLLIRKIDFTDRVEIAEDDDGDLV